MPVKKGNKKPKKAPKKPKKPTTTKKIHDNLTQFERDMKRLGL